MQWISSFSTIKLNSWQIWNIVNSRIRPKCEAPASALAKKGSSGSCSGQRGQLRLLLRSKRAALALVLAKEGSFGSCSDQGQLWLLLWPKRAAPALAPVKKGGSCSCFDSGSVSRVLSDCWMVHICRPHILSLCLEPKKKFCSVGELILTYLCRC